MKNLNRHVGIGGVPDITFEIGEYQYICSRLIKFRKVKNNNGQVVLILEGQLADENLDFIFKEGLDRNISNIKIKNRRINQHVEVVGECDETYSDLRSYRCIDDRESGSINQNIYVFTNFDDASEVNKAIDCYLDERNIEKLKNSKFNIGVDYRDINRIIDSIEKLSFDSLKIDDSIVKEIGECITKQVLENSNKI